VKPHRALSQTLRDFVHDLVHLSRDLRLLAVALFIWGIGEGIFFFYQPLFLAQWGASPATIGIVFSAGGVEFIIAIFKHLLIARFLNNCWFMFVRSLPCIIVARGGTQDI